MSAAKRTGAVAGGGSELAGGRSAVVQQVIYTLRFQGTATRRGIDGNVLTIVSTAPSCVLASSMTADGLRGSFQPVPGGIATLEVELVLTGATTFQETGTNAFGAAGHQLRFGTVGSGSLDLNGRDGQRRGAVIRRVEGGAGQFAGSTGLVIAMFTLSDAGDTAEHQLGVILVE